MNLQTLVQMHINQVVVDYVAVNMDSFVVTPQDHITYTECKDWSIRFVQSSNEMPMSEVNATIYL